MGLGSMMAGGNPNVVRGRQTEDFYPTPIEVTRAFIVRYVAELSTARAIWEPCCGDGAMVRPLSNLGVSVYASDISPKMAASQLDFLSCTGKDLPEIDWLITNPPFHLAEQLIEHAFKIGVPKMALLLKSTFFHAKGRQGLFETYRPSCIHPLTWRPDFMGLGRPTMECAWFVWSQPCSPVTIYEPMNKIKLAS